MPGHPDFGKAFPCQCQTQALPGERVARLEQYSNLGSLSRLTFENLEQRGRSPSSTNQELFHTATGEAKAFAEGPKGWLVLAGPSGCGKTHLAAAIASRCIQLGRPVFFASVPDLLDRLRVAFNPASEVPHEELFEHVRNVSLLILDDLGQHADTPWAQEKLFQILNHRYNAELPTVVVLAVPPESLDEQMRTRLGDGRLCRVLRLASSGPSSLLQEMGNPEPRLLDRMTFDRFDVRGNNADSRGRASLEKVLEVARSFARSPQGWLVLNGPVGTGKTHMAVAIAEYRIRQGQSVFFAFVPDLMDHLRITYSPESRMSYDQLFDKVRTSPLLILDDLGAQRSSPWAEEKLYQIIVYRHNGELPTVITTNLLEEDMRPEIRSRLVDPRLVTIMTLEVPDYRDPQRRPSQSSPSQSSPSRRPTR